MPKLNQYIPQAPTPKQAAFLLLPVIEAFYGGQPGGGKAQPLAGMLICGILKGMICTPFGFKKMEDVSVGDQVVNPDGSVARVIAVHDHGFRDDLYEVTFIDGASTVVASDHLWTMRNTKRPPKADRQVLTPDGEWVYTPSRNVTTSML